MLGCDWSRVWIQEILLIMLPLARVRRHVPVPIASSLHCKHLPRMTPGVGAGLVIETRSLPNLLVATLATLHSMSLIPSAPLKLVRCPRSLAPTLVALPSMSLIPSAPFPHVFLRFLHFNGSQSCIITSFADTYGASRAAYDARSETLGRWGTLQELEFLPPNVEVRDFVACRFQLRL